MSAQSILAYLMYGNAETWVALKGNDPVGVVVFMELGPPYYSTGICPYFYMQDKDQELIKQMYEKFTDFLKQKKLKYWTFNTNIKKLGEHFKEKLKGLDMETMRTGFVYTGRRKIK